jgi:hypothetical protein
MEEGCISEKERRDKKKDQFLLRYLIVQINLLQGHIYYSKKFEENLSSYNSFDNLRMNS